MKTRKIYALSALLLLLAPANAEAGDEKKELNHIWSFDLGYILLGFSNNGFGFGMNYERLLMDHLSFRTMLGAMAFKTKESDVFSAAITSSLFVNCYLLSDTLDKLYLGLGETIDFLNYFGEGDLPNPPADVLISIAPIIGWKQNVMNLVVLDFYTNYSFLVLNSQRLRNAEDYIRSGWRFGIKFKILWRPW